MTLTRIAIIALAGTLSVTAFSAVASNYTANISEGDRSKIEAAVQAEGYDMKRMEMEDGKIEVYATKDGIRYELYLDKNFNIIKVEQDD